MKLITIVSLLFIGILYGQNKRFYYEYNFSNDSANLENKAKELLALDASAEGTIFYSHRINQIDSLYNLRDPKGSPPKFLGYPYRDVLFHEVIISKKNEIPKLYYMGGPTKNYYEINLEQKINWTILPDTNVFENFKVQMATAKINGRKWTVWFTKDIPINSGPYYFNGLPGLILIAEDDLNSHSFQLTGIANIDNVDLDFIPMFQSRQLSSNNTKVTLTTADFKKLLISNDGDFVNNVVPAGNSAEVVSSKFYDSSGNEISQADYVKNQRESRRKILKRNNNKLINDFKIGVTENPLKSRTKQ